MGHFTLTMLSIIPSDQNTIWLEFVTTLDAFLSAKLTVPDHILETMLALAKKSKISESTSDAEARRIE